MTKAWVSSAPAVEITTGTVRQNCATLMPRRSASDGTARVKGSAEAGRRVAPIGRPAPRREAAADRTSSQYRYPRGATSNGNRPVRTAIAFTINRAMPAAAAATHKAILRRRAAIRAF